jgi:hypothetical protein
MTINFYDVDGKALEVAERRVAGCREVIEGELHSDGSEVVENDQGPFTVAHEDALGHL